MGASAWLEETEVEVDPGTEAAVEMRVRNTGPLMDEFSFSPVGMAQGWISVEPSIVSLFPGAEEQVQVHFRPPRLHTTLAGASPFAVKVVPREDPESTRSWRARSTSPRSRSAASTWCPPPREAGEGRPRPARPQHRQRRAAAPARRRRPEGPAPLRLQPVDAAGRAGHGPARQVHVRPRQAFWRGESRTWPFQLILDEEGRDEPQIVGGAMLQEPLAPSWLGRAIIGVALALLALILFWFVLLKPAVEDTAHDAVSSELAPIETALVAAGITLPPTTVKGGTVPPPAPTTTTISPLGDPVDFRLSLSTPEYDVPAARRSSSPTSCCRTPTATPAGSPIAIDGQPVFDSSLDFFRDLDRHFVSAADGPAPARRSHRRGVHRAPGRQCTAAATFGAFSEATEPAPRRRGRRANGRRVREHRARRPSARCRRLHQHAGHRRRRLGRARHQDLARARRPRRPGPRRPR